jgi:hypothetical protein
MIDIPYDSPMIHYAGRWTDSGSYISSNWQGSQIRFKVTGTLNLKINATVTSGVNFASVNIDGGPTNILNFPTSGAASVSIAVPNSAEHEIVMRLGSMPTSQWNGTTYTRLTSISVDDGGALLSWGASGPLRTAFIGDSWMATQHDWPQFIDLLTYNPYPISFGGATASALNNQYPSLNSGGSPAVDPSFEAVVIGAGVNDYNAGVSLASFKASLAALIDKVRINTPAAPVILLQAPRNIGAGKNYDQYGPVLSELASEKDNTHAVLITDSEWSSYTWSDDAHLSYQSRLDYADYVESRLAVILSPGSSAYSLYMRTKRGTISIPLKAQNGELPPNSVPICTPRGNFYIELSPAGSQNEELRINTERGSFSIANGNE